jgi:hypothetical protein
VEHWGHVEEQPFNAACALGVVEEQPFRAAWSTLLAMGFSPRKRVTGNPTRTQKFRGINLLAKKRYDICC